MSNRLPIRVAYVAPSLRILGGQAVQADRLLAGWRDDPDVHAWLVPIDPVPPRPADRLLRIKYVRTIVTQLCYYPQLVRELRRADVAHVFSASYTSFLLAPLPAMLIARLLGKPVVLNYRSGEGPDHLRRSALARWALRSVDLNVVPSSFLRDVFASFGIRSEIIPNLAALDRFCYRERRTIAPRLLSTRNLEPLYNVACTLRAFAEVQRRHSDATLMVVGDGSERPRLEALARELRLSGVTFVGRVPQSEIQRYYDAADIYVQTPRIDNMPGSVIEAFASGLPVVATRVGGVPAILEDGVHGLLAPDDDHAAVAAHILKLIEEPDRARELARAASASCRHYEWPLIRGRWLGVYESLARSRARQASEPPQAAVVRRAGL